MSSKNILIAGGAGFIGSYINKMLSKAGYNTFVLDNLSRGNRETVKYGTFIKGDIGNKDDLDAIFQHHDINAVMHFAAYISVPESVENPMIYYHNNVIKTTTLLNTMLEYDIKNFIFSSSAAIFGIPKKCPISEDYPCFPINPYGETKLIVEKIVRDYSHAYNLKASCLRYFNAAGGDPEGEIVNKHTFSTNLIPAVIKNLLNKQKSITIFGTDYDTHDGTCIRDYIHIHDLATAHLLALEKLLSGGHSENYNLGNGKGFTVREVIESIERITQQKVSYIEGARRDGDPPMLLADSQKAIRELGWKQHYPNIDDIVKHAWNTKIG